MPALRPLGSFDVVVQGSAWYATYEKQGWYFGF
jgi:hypothetical protein